MRDRPLPFDEFVQTLQPVLGRRELLYLAGLGSLGLALPGCKAVEDLLERIANRPVRRNVTSSAAATDVNTYRAAVTAMKALPSTDKRSWNNQALIHQNFCPHGNWLFLPWHRAYLWYFEEICRELTGVEGFALPYWNWSSSPSIPPQFWGSPNSLNHTNRSASSTTAMSSTSTGPVVIESILDETNFLVFGSDDVTLAASQRANAGYGRLEGTPHNHVHGRIGGDMGTYMSPLDPVFWCHHNMVECCWVDWNVTRNNPNTNDSDWTNREFTEFCDRTGAPVTVKVSDMLLWPLVAYRFDDPDLGTPGESAETLSASDAQLTQQQADRMEKHLERGATVRYETLDRVTLAQTLLVALDAPRDLPPAPRVPELRVESLGGGARQRVQIVLNDVALNHTEDFFVRVFLDEPGADASTSTDRAGFVGEFSFFGHSHDGHAPKGRYRLDATDALMRLGRPAGAPVVTLVLVPYADRLPRSSSLEVGSVELTLARTVVED